MVAKPAVYRMREKMGYRNSPFCSFCEL